MRHVGEKITIKSKEWYNENKDTNGNDYTPIYSVKK